VVITWLRFRSRIPDHIKPIHVDTMIFIRDRIGGILGTVCLMTSLVMMIASPWLEPLPMVPSCLPPTFSHFLASFRNHIFVCSPFHAACISSGLVIRSNTGPWFWFWVGIFSDEGNWSRGPDQG